MQNAHRPQEGHPEHGKVFKGPLSVTRYNINLYQHAFIIIISIEPYAINLILEIDSFKDKHILTHPK